MTVISLADREFKGELRKATHVAIPVDCCHVFGSGAGGAKASIDSRDLWALADERGWHTWDDNNGFLCFTYVDVPISELAAARKVTMRREAYPGSKIRYSGTGKGFLKWVARNWARAPRRAGNPLEAAATQESMWEKLLTSSVVFSTRDRMRSLYFEHLARRAEALEKEAVA